MLFRLALVWYGLFDLVFCPVVGCGVVLSARPSPSRCDLRLFLGGGGGAVLIALPRPPPGCLWCPALSVVVRCVLWCCGLWCFVCFAWCFVAWLCCAGSCCAVLVVLCWHVLLCSLLVFFALFPAFPLCSGPFLSVRCSAVVRLADRHSVLVLASFALCCLVLCRAVVCLLVLCCVVCFVAVLGSHLASSAAVGLLCSVCPWARCCVVLLCCLWSPRCRSLRHVSGRLPSRGASCVVLCGCVCVVDLCAVLSRPSGAGWCCVLLPVVFGCLLLGLAALCCLLAAPGVVFRPCLAAWLAALWFVVVCFGALLPCVVFSGAVLSCGGVLSCSAVCLCRRLCLLFVSCRRAVCCVCSAVLHCDWSASCGALLPCVTSSGAVLSCGAVVSCSGVFLRCCVCLLLLFSLQPLQNP